MGDLNAKVAVSIGGGSIRLEGSEAFVKEQLAIFADAIKEAIGKSASYSKQGGHAASGAVTPDSRPPLTPTDQTYENLFALNGEKIQILKDIPGSSKAKKMVNAALLALFGASLMGKDTQSFDEIRDLCEAHGCLDGTNFSNTIQSEKEWFLVDGVKGGNKNAKLTVPGKKKAKELAESVVGETAVA